MTKYLITGGAGFIGSNLAQELLRRGQQVRILDNFSTGSRENLKDFIDDIELIEGDLQSYERVHNAVKGVDIVFHQGALPSVPRSIQDPLTTNSVNVIGTLNVLLAARDENVKRVIFASSSSVYGANKMSSKVETMAVAPLAPYAVSKLSAECYCKAFSKVYGLETVSLRYFNVFGPRQDPTSQYSAVIPKFISKMLKGETPVIYGDGTQSRDFTFIDNVINANLLASEVEGVAGEAFNVACGETHSINKLVSILNKTTGTNIKPINHEPRLGEIKNSLANISKAQKLLNYAPTIGFEEGLAETVAWLKNETKMPLTVSTS